MIIPIALLTMMVSSPTIDLKIDLRRPGIEVSKTLYGAFFEEINHAGDGGIYSELLQNRGFERGANGSAAPEWLAVEGTATLDGDNPFNEAKPRSLKLKGSVVNKGYWGISLVKGESYKLVAWAKGSGSLTVALGSTRGELGPLNSTWKKYEFQVTPQETDAAAQLKVNSNGRTAWIGFASLMPINASAGAPMRADLATWVNNMHPAFLRFPGGCFVEGQDFDRAWNWRLTIGPIEQRPGKDWRFWGYSSTDGLGFHEYLQWCEDMGCAALFVTNCGMTHGPYTPMDKMDAVVKDAVDAIEYANGPVTSTYGALRAKNGHPKPFNLKFVEIGNENGGPIYNQHYTLIAKAIKTRFPQIQLVACVWGGVPTSYPLELIDEHYYSDPTFFWSQIHKYDTYDRKGPKVYVGEYAVTNGCGQGNLAAALGEAAFMTGMERNSDVVKMASYAPLFVNVNNKQWNPNAIVFDNHQSYGTPSYWVQRLFAQNRPDRLLPSTSNVQAASMVISGSLGLQTWKTHAEFKDVSVESEGKLRTVNDWESQSGDWTFKNGIYSQAELGENKVAIGNQIRLAARKDFTVRLKAKKVAGDEGFIVMLNVGNGQGIQFNLGGWQNTKHGFQISGGGPVNGGVAGSIEADRWYNVEVRLRDLQLSGFLDGHLIQSISLPKVYDFAQVVGVDELHHEVVVKLVNGADAQKSVHLTFNGPAVSEIAEVTVLTGPDLAAENDFKNPIRIAPTTRSQSLGPARTYTMPPHSVSILRMRRSDIK